MSKDSYKDHLYALIFCGGGGTRLWPYSRQETPKQFLSLGGGKTLIRQTFERVYPEIPLGRIWVVTVPEYKDEVKEELPEIPQKQLLVEPARRDTLLAAGLGVVAIQQRDPEAVIANLWSDQVIDKKKRFLDSLYAGAKTAFEKQSLVTTGVPPKYAHPGLEYVKKGKRIEKHESASVYELDEFIERPSRTGKDPKKLLKSSDNLWHIGLWIWRADVFISSVKKHAKETYERLEVIKKYIGDTKGWKNVVKEYEAAPIVQIDMVISKEKKKKYVVEGSFGWLDLGDFQVMWRMSNKDKDGNGIILENQGEWYGIDTKKTLIFNKGKRLIATVGVKDLAVVAVDDMVLVIPRARAQEVKKIVNWLKENKKTEYL